MRDFDLNAVSLLVLLSVQVLSLTNLGLSFVIYEPSQMLVLRGNT